MSRTHFILASIITNTDEAGEYITEARQMGIDVLPPDINRSQVQISSQDDKIYFGLVDVKNAAVGASKYAVALREEVGEFESYEHFCELIDERTEIWEETGKVGRSPRQICSARSVNAWRDAGAFDSVGYTEDLHVRAALQKEVLGVSLVDIWNPLLETYGDKVKGLKSLGEALQSPTGTSERTYAVVGERDIRRTRKDAHPRFANREYALVTLEWRETVKRMACFAQVWEKYSGDLSSGAFCIFTLKLTGKGPQIERVECLT